MLVTRREALVGFAALGCTASALAKETVLIEPFQIPWDPDMVADLDRRLGATRWPDAVTTDWSYGMEEGFLAKLTAYWERDYAWSDRRAKLNRLPHFRATIDGFGVHFLHFRGYGRNAIPLLLMNGWPSSFVEYQRLAPLLAEGEPPFDIVIPTYPGFGFTDRPTRPYQVEPADLYAKLMTALGHDRFMVSGTDIGTGVATRLALDYPDRVLGVHISAVSHKPASAGEPPPTAAELAYMAADVVWDRDEGGYQAIQTSRPQTLAFGLADSPTGLASWIVDKFRAWSDCRGDVLSVFPAETLVDNLMVYWTTNTIASSNRYYYEAVHHRPRLRPETYVRPPTAIAIWPRDVALPPREMAERLYNVRRYTVFPRGGHCPAWEAPELYADDLRQFAISIAA
ncbi:epoxide hydrolase family protein [Lichenicola sp.]|uniref:epoxide hydrolase family protein n=1 Tax=Lichenicola sp. TaxID=2804529 RepID=UPI003AFF91D0